MRRRGLKLHETPVIKKNGAFIGGDCYKGDTRSLDYGSLWPLALGLIL